MIVTIDGPAGAGKSTAARRLASELGFRFLDTGAMYRAIALTALREHGGLEDWEKILATARRIRLDVDQDVIRVDGVDVSREVRTPEVAGAASAIAQNPSVRELMVEAQRRIGSGGNYVCEGRDQGTVVFPLALRKFFLTASSGCRALRRQADMLQRGIILPLDEVLQQQTERDHRDSTRQTGPLVPAEDAIVIDTTDLTLDEVVARMKRLVEEALEAAATAEVAGHGPNP